jgi:thymidylate kinase
MAPPGKLFVFEGPDGVGKTTLSKAFSDHLNATGIQCDYLSFPGRETGSLGRHIYELHHDPNRFGIKAVDPASLQLLHIAAHIDLIGQCILPKLASGRYVILDRFWWSTWVYGVTAGVDRNILRSMLAVERTYWGNTFPTVVFLLQSDRPHRREQPAATWNKLAATYYELADEQQHAYPIRIISNNQSISAALDTVVQAIDQIAREPVIRPSVELGAHFSSNTISGPADAQLSLDFIFDTDNSSAAPVPTIITPLDPVKSTEVFDTYWRFAVERQNIFFRKFARLPPPWTNDPILERHKFTNAYRASDRVSQYLIRHVIYTGDQSPEEVFFRIILFKIFNRIETWQLLQQEIGSITYSDYNFERYDAVLSNAMADGAKIFSAAYVMPAGDTIIGFTKKHRNYLKLLERMLEDEVPARITEMRSMQQVFELLRSYPMMGDFLAYQYTTDINYSILTDFSEMTFVIPGPGARSGIRKCFSDLGGLNEADIIRLVTERQHEECERLGLTFRSLWGRPLQLIDCQNLFCEVDKYARVAHPERKGIDNRSRIKQIYQPKAVPIAYWYPPRWGLNQRIEQELSGLDP